jgi:hypothetical protein
MTWDGVLVMASTELPSQGPVRLGSVNLPPGRLISGHFEGESVVWATDNPVPRSGWVWTELSALQPRTGLVPIHLDGLDAGLLLAGWWYSRDPSPDDEYDPEWDDPDWDGSEPEGEPAGSPASTCTSRPPAHRD